MIHLEHAALYVAELEEAARFFESYLGATAHPPYHNPKTGFRSIFLTFGQAGCRLELMQRPDALPAPAGQLSLGYHHLAFSLGSKEAVDALTERLRRDGYPLLSGPRTTGDGYYESLIAAVEGLLLELTV